MSLPAGRVRGGQSYWQCHACHYQASLRAGTVFEHTKRPLTKSFFATYLLRQSKTNVAARELTRHLDVCYRSVGGVPQRLRNLSVPADPRLRHGDPTQIHGCPENSARFSLCDPWRPAEPLPEPAANRLPRVLFPG